MLYGREDFVNTIRIFDSSNGDWSVVFFDEEKVYENHSLDFSIVMEKLVPLINGKIELKTYEIDGEDMEYLAGANDLKEFLSVV